MSNTLHPGWAVKGLVVGMGANLCVCVSVRVPEHRVHWVVSAPFIVVLIRNDNKERCNHCLEDVLLEDERVDGIEIFCGIPVTLSDLNVERTASYFDPPREDGRLADEGVIRDFAVSRIELLHTQPFAEWSPQFLL